MSSVERNWSHGRYVFLPIGGRPKRKPDALAIDPSAPVEPPPPHLRVDQIAKTLKRHAKRAGIDGAARITGHSARVGSAVDLIDAGHTPTAAAYAGGWKSERMVRHYAKRSLAGNNAMADLRRQQAKEPAEDEA